MRLWCQSQNLRPWGIRYLTDIGSWTGPNSGIHNPEPHFITLRMASRINFLFYSDVYLKAEQLSEAWAERAENRPLKVCSRLTPRIVWAERERSEQRVSQKNRLERWAANRPLTLGALWLFAVLRLRNIFLLTYLLTYAPFTCSARNIPDTLSTTETRPKSAKTAGYAYTFPCSQGA